jgi:hypothetical protein
VAGLKAGGQLGFDSWQGQGIYLFATASRLALGPTKHSVVTRDYFPGGKVVLGCEADHAPPSSTKVQYALNYTSIPPYSFMV